MAALLGGAAHAQTLRSQTTWGGQGSDTAQGVAVAGDGSSYMVGLSDSFTFDVFGTPRPAISLVKFSASGAVVWQRLWEGETQPGGLRGPSVALTADQGSVYVSGITNTNGGDAVLLKFDAATGGLLWQRTWGGPGREESEAVATDTQGNAYITGTQDNFDSNGVNMFVVKFSAAGAVTWQKATNGATGSAVAVAPDGQVYAAGSRARAGGLAEFDLLALKLTSAGALVWDRTYSAGQVVDARGGMTVGSDGGPILAGAIQAGKRVVGISALVVRLGADGALLFDSQWGGKNGTSAGGVGLAPDGSIHVAGQGSLTDGANDAFVVHVSTDGRGLDATTWGGSGFDSGHGVGVAADGTVVLAASTTTGPPYALLDASRKVSAVRGTVAAAGALLVDATGSAAASAAAVIIPDGRTAYAGNFEQALVRFIR
ncbi:MULTISPECIES: hypothetical protein [Ramlibacter]|uniref:Bulb-type lectin domain-containing protein n=1 Tax=Ramlibacter pinisoli TaxID=2682844 RepID=A0A6N8IW15_9BURK|nr:MULTISPECIES: hypothetical protein [Ramlibacter]MBA2965221.1 hypothetical protein [Ramlibacter sp. CGMCC 1.13660]MVQ30186.1 hypothetical protein [Ramlibacter pinisoli]